MALVLMCSLSSASLLDDLYNLMTGCETTGAGGRVCPSSYPLAINKDVLSPGETVAIGFSLDLNKAEWGDEYNPNRIPVKFWVKYQDGTPVEAFTKSLAEFCGYQYVVSECAARNPQRVAFYYTPPSYFKEGMYTMEAVLGTSSASENFRIILPTTTTLPAPTTTIKTTTTTTVKAGTPTTTIKSTTTTVKATTTSTIPQVIKKCDANIDPCSFNGGYGPYIITCSSRTKYLEREHRMECELGTNKCWTFKTETIKTNYRVQCCTNNDCGSRICVDGICENKPSTPSPPIESPIETTSTTVTTTTLSTTTLFNMPVLDSQKPSGESNPVLLAIDFPANRPSSTQLLIIAFLVMLILMMGVYAWMRR